MSSFAFSFRSCRSFARAQLNLFIMLRTIFEAFLIGNFIILLPRVPQGEYICTLPSKWTIRKTCARERLKVTADDRACVHAKGMFLYGERAPEGKGIFRLYPVIRSMLGNMIWFASF